MDHQLCKYTLHCPCWLLRHLVGWFCTICLMKRKTSKFGRKFLPWGLKLNNGGSGRPFGRRVFGSLNSSKKGWTQASNCSTSVDNHSTCTIYKFIWKNICTQKSKTLTAVHRRLGEYCKNLQTRSTDSGGKRFWKTWWRNKRPKSWNWH